MRGEAAASHADGCVNAQAAWTGSFSAEMVNPRGPEDQIAPAIRSAACAVAVVAVPWT